MNLLQPAIDGCEIEIFPIFAATLCEGALLHFCCYFQVFQSSFTGTFEKFRSAATRFGFGQSDFGSAAVHLLQKGLVQLVNPQPYVGSVTETM